MLEATAPLTGRLAQQGAQQGAEAGEAGEELTPCISGCTAGKFYQPPPFLRSLRPKRKVAIVFGYVGEKYHGLQWTKSPGHPTVEEALLRALFETGMISPANMGTTKVQQKLDFERASRTDKGVHALRNVVSLNAMLPYDPAYVVDRERELAEVPMAAETPSDGGDGGGKPQDADRFSYAEAKRLLNVALPSDIHVYDVVPVTRSFNAYLMCGWRRYEYYLPTFCLMSKEEYSERFFPASLAPSKPSLQEVGVRPSCRDGSRRDGAQEEDGTTGSSSSERDKRAGNGFGRKSKGHFPMRKGKKMRLEAEAEGKSSVGVPAAIDDDDVDDAQTAGRKDEAEETARHPEEVDEQDVEGVGESRLPLDEATATHFHDGIFEQLILFRAIPEDAMRHVAANYRLSSAQLERVRELFRQYEGTLSYHNFTPGGRGNDPSCTRFVKKIAVSSPFVVYPDKDAEDDDTATGAMEGKMRISSELIRASMAAWDPLRFSSSEGNAVEGGTSAAPGGEELSGDERLRALGERAFQHMSGVYGGGGGIEVVRVELDGQSFLLHQIRKMIGAVICCCATNSAPSVIREQLLHKGHRRGVPMAPANGLFLSYLNFDLYNLKLSAIQSHGPNAGKKEGLELDSVDQAELAGWRAKTVAVVLRNEMVHDICGRWMRSLRCVLRLAWDTELP